MGFSGENRVFMRGSLVSTFRSAILEMTADTQVNNDISAKERIETSTLRLIRIWARLEDSQNRLRTLCRRASTPTKELGNEAKKGTKDRPSPALTLI